MELRYAFIADAATAAPDAKVNAIGILHTIHAPQFPWVQHLLALVASFDVKPSDYGTTRDIYLRLITADGTSLREQRINATIPKPDPNATAKLQVFNVVMAVQGTTFEKAGTYEFVVEINTRHMASIPFEVVQAQMPNPPS